jgi:hypothetical protein
VVYIRISKEDEKEIGVVTCLTNQTWGNKNTGGGIFATKACLGWWGVENIGYLAEVCRSRIKL